ncbi:MAG: 4'-phosphopantetheinyl transferase superfamily protein [Clostridia bacterium]|nr:4'-phosphopantetheinyl transferase superfamily protein [Clostridia bacterium]
MYEIKNINDISEQEYARTYALLSHEKKERVDAFRFEADRKRTLAGEWLVRELIARNCGVAPDSIEFAVHQNGKPYCKNVQVHFNISHSADLVICALSSKPVGADIEQMRPMEQKIMRYACTAQEAEYVFQADTGSLEQQKRFFKVWTAKEAYLKFLGTGLTDFKSVCVLEKEIAENTTTFFEGDYAVSIYES